MRLNKVSIRTSIYNMLGLDLPPVSAKMSENIVTVRAAMLNTLGDDGLIMHANIHRKIRYATDIDGLWYCRSELMAVLAETYGEVIARETMASITAMFVGLMPEGLLARSSNSAPSKRRK